MNICLFTAAFILSFQKNTVETMKKCALRQNKAKCKRILSQANDNIGLKGDTCKNHVNNKIKVHHFYYSDACGKNPCTSHTQTPETDRDPDHKDFVNKENRGATMKT